MAAITTRAILLRGYDYGDSSRILRFYTESHGLLSVVARGVRGRSGKGAATLSSFASGELIAYVRPNRELHTMKDFTSRALRDDLARDVLRFGGASAAAELVLVHTEQEAQPGLYEALEGGLDAISDAEPRELPGVVLAALWTITAALGFAPQLDGCIRCGEALERDEVGRFDLAAGGVRCSECASDSAGPRIGPVARGQVGALVRGFVPEGLTHYRQHLGLVSDFVAFHIASKPLKSLRFLGGVLPSEEPEVPVE